MKYMELLERKSVWLDKGDPFKQSAILFRQFEKDNRFEILDVRVLQHLAQVRAIALPILVAISLMIVNVVARFGALLHQTGSNVPLTTTMVIILMLSFQLRF